MKITRDHQARSEQMGEIVRVTAEEKEKVRHVLASYAQDSQGRTTLADADRTELIADAEMLMMALGVHPTQKDSEDYLTGPAAPHNTTRYPS